MQKLERDRGPSGIDKYPIRATWNSLIAGVVYEHDSRFAYGYGLAYAVSPRGACHMASLNYPVESGSMYIPDIPELAADIIESDSDEKAVLNIACQEFGMFISSCTIFCNLGALPLNAEQAVNMVNHVTGFGYTLEEVMTICRRIWYLKRGLSNLFGARKQDDSLPKRLLTPLKSGPTEGSTHDMDLILKEFCAMRGLNENGLPEKDVLEKNGLDALVTLLYSQAKRPEFLPSPLQPF